MANKRSHKKHSTTPPVRSLQEMGAVVNAFREAGISPLGIPPGRSGNGHPPKKQRHTFQP